MSEHCGGCRWHHVEEKYLCFPFTDTYRHLGGSKSEPNGRCTNELSPYHAKVMGWYGGCGRWAPKSADQPAISETAS